MSVYRGIEDPEPVGRAPGTEALHRVSRSTVVATGTLACPACDAPVLPDGPLSPADAIACPYCAHDGRVREFLSLEAPARPAHVVVRVVPRRQVRLRAPR